MSAFYVMQYVGREGMGAGALYIGKGLVVGMDATGGRYEGTYTEDGGKLRGSVVLSVPQGTELVTGVRADDGPMRVHIRFDFPINFADRGAQTVLVEGQPVQVAFEKLRDIP